MKASLFTDGACLGNPGPMGLGVVLTVDDHSFELSVPAGMGTNNQAEYLALIKGLRFALDRGVTVLTAHLDSELVVKQVNSEWRVKDDKLLPLFDEARELLARFVSVTVVHVPRELNSRADSLSKRAAS